MEFAMDCFLAAVGIVLMITVVPRYIKAKVTVQEFFTFSGILAFFIYSITNLSVGLIIVWSMWE